MGNSNLMEPFFANEDKCICFSSNDQFVPCMAVMLQSIIENSSSEHYYDIIILHKDITAMNQSLINGMIKDYSNISIRFCNIEKYIGKRSFYTANEKRLSSEAYFRLFIPWIVSKKYRLALYMDSDMICRRDLYDIFEYEPKDELISGVKDYWGICNCYIPGDDRKGYRLSIGLFDIDSYIISATLIFNLNKFRQLYTLDTVIELAASRDWRQHDQDVINILCRGSIRHIDATWGMVSDYGNNCYLPEKLFNELKQAEESFISVAHFAGGIRKPWAVSYTDYDLEFWRYADHTPYIVELFSRIKSPEYKNYVAYHLTDGNIEEYYSGGKLNRIFHGVSLGNIDQGHTRYQIIKIDGDNLHLEGMVGFFGTDINTKVEIFLSVNGKRHPATSTYTDNGHRDKGDIYTYRGEAFSFDYKLDKSVKKYEIKIVCKINGLFIEKTNVGFEKFCPLGREYKHCYYITDKWRVGTNKKALYITPNKSGEKMRSEKKIRKELRQKKTPAAKKAYYARLLVGFLRKFLKKPIWLISDRVSRADENGEVFFRYLNKEKKDEIDSYFVISKNSPDYDRLKTYGNVVDPGSRKHKVLVLLSSYIVSSQTDEIYRNPFGKNFEPYRDLLNKSKFVFLQHGIISNDLSGWLCKKRQNFTGFVTSTKREYELVLSNEKYHYDPDVIWLTGLPRFDLLEDNRKNIITVMPTWRMYLAVRQDKETGKWILVNNFKNTVYATFYRELFNNARLKAAAKKYGYVLQFKLHPSFLGNEDKFGFGKDVKILKEDVSYRQIYSESSLVVTDYSSSIYDFIYLRKPIIYAQFDADEFFSGKHIYERGNFDYEKEGFGEVCYDLESTVDRIIEYMENDCALKPVYEERINNEFAFSDKNNCKRVYEKIIATKENN